MDFILHENTIQIESVVKEVTFAKGKRISIKMVAGGR